MLLSFDANAYQPGRKSPMPCQKSSCKNETDKKKNYNKPRFSLFLQGQIKKPDSSPFWTMALLPTEHSFQIRLV
jgi:hypothetical protein